jgi:hypothetical protein
MLCEHMFTRLNLREQTCMQQCRGAYFFVVILFSFLLLDYMSLDMSLV